MDPRDLERRLRRLERFNSLLLTGLVIVTALLLIAAPTTADREIIRTERLEIVDPEGRVRMELKHDAEETGLFILDQFGHRRLGAAQFAHGGGGFALHGPETRGAAVLYLRGDGSLTFYDESGAVVNRFPSQP